MKRIGTLLGMPIVESAELCDPGEIILASKMKTVYPLKVSAEEREGVLVIVASIQEPGTSGPGEDPADQGER